MFPSLDELRAIWNAVENEPRRDLVRFMLLMPLRRGEAAGLRWSEVDLKQDRIQIPADRTKNGEAHELPLSTPARKIIEANMASSGLVFPASTGKPHAAWDDFLIRLRKRIDQSAAAKAERFVLHDTRRAFVSHLAERGFDIDLLDQCLGHSRKGVLGVYQRASRMAERARALETWAGLVTGAPARATAGGWWRFRAAGEGESRRDYGFPPRVTKATSPVALVGLEKIPTDCARGRAGGGGGKTLCRLSRLSRLSIFPKGFTGRFSAKALRRLRRQELGDPAGLLSTACFVALVALAVFRKR